MNRWILPVATVVVVAAATAAATFVVPAQQPPAGKPPAEDARLSLVCPTVTTATATVEIAAAATGPGLRTAALTSLDTPTDAEGVAVLTAPAVPQVVSGLRSTTFGGVTTVRSAAGPERGLAAATCASPAIEQWFAGVGMNENAQADLVLTNVDNVDAIVDVTVFGDQGRIPSPGVRGIVVAAASTRTLPLSVVASSPTPVTLQVVSGQGRVAATLWERLWDGGTPLGADWVPQAAAPAEQVVIPGVPDGEGLRQLVITNPGERTTGVALDLLTEDGRSQAPGLENLEIPPGTTRVFDLTNALAGQAAALSLAADHPVTAAVRAASPGEADRSDPVWASALGPIGADGLWPLPSAGKAAVVLQLANPGDADANATVTFGEAPATNLTVPAGSVVRVPVLAAPTALVRVQGAGDVLRGAILIREDQGRLRGLAAVPLVTSETTMVVPTATFDPHAG